MEEYFIDSESGLLLRKVIVTETMLADIPDQTDYFDYRPVDGVKVPFTIRSSAVNPRDLVTRRATAIVQNKPVDAKEFEMPAAKK